MNKLFSLTLVMLAFLGYSQPTSPAPTPGLPQTNVISLFSDGYSNATINTWLAPWSQGSTELLNIQGNSTRRYFNFNFVGIEFLGPNSINATAAEFFHIDIWTANLTQFRIRIVDFGTDNAFGGGDDTFHEVTINNPLQNQWVSLAIPMTQFTGLTGRANISQLVLAGSPIGQGDVYVDNIYFSFTPPAQGEIATLSDLRVNGVTIPNFSSQVQTYNFGLPPGTVDIPQVSATPTDEDASVSITQATALPGSATVQVTSESGLVVLTYTVNFSIVMPTSPQTAAPNPTLPQTNVISLFSNVYTNVPVNTWLAPWSQGTTELIQIQGNDTRRYFNLNFVGIEFLGANSLNVTQAEFFNIDIWTPNLTQFRIRLVDFGPDNSFGGGDDTFHEITIDNPNLHEWVTLSIPMSQFIGLTGRANLSQMVFAGLPLGQGNVFIDNIYFSFTPPAQGEIATLSDLSVNGTTIQNFSSQTFVYSFGLPPGTTDVPVITATPTDENATVQITQATGIPGTATVEVTSANGLVVQSYSVNFTIVMPTEPQTAAPTPQIPQENVISLFSDAYTNVPVNTWLTPWSQAAMQLIQIEGNNTKRYSNLGFAGIEFLGPNSIDVSEAEFFHIDIWTPNMTDFRVNLVDFGPNNSFGGGDDTNHEIIVQNPNQHEWVSLAIPMSDFVGLTGRNNLSQMVISGLSPGSGTVFVDNIYFSKPEQSTVPQTALRPDFCNITLSAISANLFASFVPDATAFRFKVSLAGFPDEVIETPGMLFRLTELSNPQFGVTYSIQVAAQVDGQWGAYGAACTVTTPATIPTTQLRAPFCNITVTAPTANLFADPVSGATAVRFRVSLNGNEVQVIETTSLSFSLAQLANPLSNTTYSVEVAAQVAGTWGAYGPACDVTTPPFAATRLRDGFCNVVITNPNANLFARPVQNADAFRYRVTNLTTNAVDVVVREDSNILRFVLTTASSYSPDNHQYAVEVAARVGGVWGDYTEICSVTVGQSSVSRENAMSGHTYKAYPNPFTTQTTIAWTKSADTQAHISVYDVTGKLIQSIQTQESSVQLGQEYNAGVYLVTIIDGEQQIQTKVVKR